MKYKYVADSCCEFPDFFAETHDCVRVPLTIMVGSDTFIDDDTFNQAEFLKKVAEYPKCPKSSCPSPESYMKAFDGDADAVFVTTLSADLSGSYNSAMLARELYLEENPKKKIHVFNSESASGGEAQILMKAAELAEQGLSFEEIVEKTTEFARSQQTYFVLESLETLRKNGRLSAMKALAATALNIKPVCKSNHGVIEQVAIARGMKKALDKMVDMSLEAVPDTKDRTLYISHVNCKERAEKVLASYVAKAEFARTIINDTAGISSMYANDGGIIVTI